ncbi:MAG TPA: DUF6542 domain-containing protein [Streptosporangiaceae bacterium]
MSERQGHGAYQRPPRRQEPDYYDDRVDRGVPYRDTQPGYGARDYAPHRGRPGQPGSLARRWGSLPGRLGVVIVIGCALLGALGTMLTGSQPGTLLSLFLLAGTVLAGLAVRQNMAHFVIPVPALAYPLAALAAGAAANPAGSSLTGLGLGAVQWIAHGFLPMVAATALAIGITAVRRWRSATSPAPARGRRPARPADRYRDRSPYDPRSPYDEPARPAPDRRHSPRRYYD